MKKLFLPVSLLLIVASSVIISQLVIAFTLQLLQLDLTHPAVTTSFVGLSFSLAGLILFLISRHPKFKTSLIEIGLIGLPSWQDILLAPLALIATMIIATVFIAIANLFPGFNPNEAQNVGFKSNLMNFDLMLAFFSLAIIAPIAEELIFRGWLYGKLRTRLNLISSALLTSLVFGLLHFQWNVGITVFAMSIIACLLREITNTIYAPILLHFLKNALAFYLIFILNMV